MLELFKRNVEVGDVVNKILFRYCSSKKFKEELNYLLLCKKVFYSFKTQSKKSFFKGIFQ
jgi:hypothetical protein